ncbi:sphingosine kinase 2-like [Dendronephthya gigantea]|uniref:sphingosine kinase 2-like n=1 Tax=Dendronephthya gigantea TaxID=151771 RepID=UPI00106A0E21|nr:sphingosine kinase 2-like [Dendronephthya gigantea]
MKEEKDAFFKDVFKIGPSFKTDFTVSLTSTSITYENDLAKSVEEIHLEDVIGVNVNHSDNGIECSYIHVFSYPLRKKLFFKEAKRQRVEHVFAVSSKGDAGDHLKTAESWVRCIKWLLIKDADVKRDVKLASTHQDYPPKQQYLVVVNPFGGKGTAQKVFDTNVKPMLEEADVDYHLEVTEHRGHAREIIQELDGTILRNFDCIICCSGDGIINEVVNGLMSRQDWEEAIKTPIGHIPCGSGNGLCAASLYHSGEPFDIISSVFTILTGVKCPLDIIKTQTSNPQPCYSFLAIAYGIGADVDIESEKYRFMGEYRFNFMGLKKIFQKQIFSGKLWYLPIGDNVCVSNSHEDCGDDVNKQEQNLRDGKLEDVILSDCTLKSGDVNNVVLNTTNCDLSNGAAGTSDTCEQKESVCEQNLGDGNLKNGVLGNGILDDGILKKVKSNDGSTSDGVLVNGSHVHEKPVIPSNFLPDFQAPIPDSWKVMEGDFIGWVFINTSHIGKDAFFAPEGVFGDGIIHCMCLGGEMTRADLCRVLTQMDTGGHVNVHGVTMLKARAFRFEPKLARSKIFTIDGEEFKWDTLQAEVFKGLGHVRCREPAVAGQPCKDQ